MSDRVPKCEHPTVASWWWTLDKDAVMVRCGGRAGACPSVISIPADELQGITNDSAMLDEIGNRLRAAHPAPFAQRPIFGTLPRGAA